MHSILTDEKRLKQVGLGLSMKGGIRSKKFISYLNNLGHSYDVFLRTGTSWVMELMDASDGYCTIPSNIQPNIFAKAAFGNGGYCQKMSLSMSQVLFCISKLSVTSKMLTSLS